MLTWDAGIVGGSLMPAPLNEFLIPEFSSLFSINIIQVANVFLKVQMTPKSIFLSTSFFLPHCLSKGSKRVPSTRKCAALEINRVRTQSVL